MKNLLLFVFISAAVVVNSGCSSKLMSFEKRKYTRGYHIDFATKNEKKHKASFTETAVVIPQKEVKELVTADNETTYEPLPEITAAIELTADAEEPTQHIASPEKKKFFQNPILKHFNGAKIKTVAQHSMAKLLPQKNTAGTNQTMDTSIFSIIGAIIAGGSLVALGVMLISNWATTMLLIAFLGGILLGLILLIIGANS